MRIKFEYPIVATIAAVALICMTSCKKEEGEGGRSSISGKVIEQDIFSAQDPYVQNEYPLTDERVYIIYGDASEVYDDDMRTDFEGRYKFRFLREGTYTIFTYTECNVIQDTNCLASGGVYPVLRTVELGKNEDVVVEDMVIQNY